MADFLSYTRKKILMKLKFWSFNSIFDRISASHCQVRLTHRAKRGSQLVSVLLIRQTKLPNQDVVQRQMTNLCLPPQAEMDRNDVI